MVTGIGQSNFVPLNPFLPTPSGAERESSASGASPPPGRTAEETAETQENRPARGENAASSLPSENTGASELTREEQLILQQLRSADLEVRRHEQAHLAAAGQYATSGASFQYQRGPDGRLYAVGGEVSISTSSEATPEATLRKARVIRRAAVAPANPSSQDRRVAAQATRLENQAHREIAQENLAEIEEKREARGVAETDRAADGSGDADGGEAGSTSSEPITRPTVSPPNPTSPAGQIIDLIG
jgi:SprA family protein